MGAVSQSERRMRKMLRRIYPEAKHPLFNHRPAWLNGCELDVFYPDLGLAFEFNGPQHYQFTPRYHASESDLFAQMERDRFKSEACPKRGIRLIIVLSCHLASEETLRDHISSRATVPERSRPKSRRGAEKPPRQWREPRKKRASIWKLLAGLGSDD